MKEVIFQHLLEQLAHPPGKTLGERSRQRDKLMLRFGAAWRRWNKSRLQLARLQLGKDGIYLRPKARR